MIRVLAVVVLLAGCGDGASPSSEPTAQASALSAIASVSATDMTRAEFRTHVQQAITGLNGHIDEIQAALDEPIPDIATQLAALGLLTWAADEDEWVRDNLPAACYRDAWAKYGEAVDLYQSAAEAFGDASDNFERAISDGTTLAEEAQAALEESGSLQPRPHARRT